MAASGRGGRSLATTAIGRGLRSLYCRSPVYYLVLVTAFIMLVSAVLRGPHRSRTAIIFSLLHGRKRLNVKPISHRRLKGGLSKASGSLPARR